MSYIRVNVDSRDLDILIRNLNNFGEKVRGEAQSAIVWNANELRSDYKSSIPVGSRRKHLRDSVIAVIKNLDATVGSSSPLAHIFESGHKSYTIRPRGAKKNKKGRVTRRAKTALHFGDVFAKSANIPAQPGTNALGKSYERIKPKIKDDLVHILQTNLK